MRRTGLLLAATAFLMVCLTGVALAATIDGDRRDNRLVGTERADTIRGLGGDDTIYGGPGRDTVQGGEGSDVLRMRDGVAGNDTARCGHWNGDDVAYVDSRDEASGENAFCETVWYRAEATGMVRESELYLNASPYTITDEASGASYELLSDTENLSDYTGRRVFVSGEVLTDGRGYGLPMMDVKRIEFAELEPAGR